MAARGAIEVLIVSSRFPWPPHRGDALRAAIWLEALRDVAHVTLVAPPGAVPPEFGYVRHVPVRRTALALLAGVGRVISRGWPLQTLLAARFDWAGAFRGLADPKFDAAIVLLSRLDPLVRPLVRARFKVLDAVDSLARNAAERGAAAGATRALWSVEARRLEALETSAADGYDAVVVVSDEERDAFGGGATAISNGVEIGELRDGERAYDFGFWGRLAYFANRDALTFLLREIWPVIRAERPAATLLIAGADAPAWVRGRSGCDGVTVVSPMEGRAALLRHVRIALVPVRFGSGQSNKVLEAAEAGCAIVAHERALRGLGEIEAATGRVSDAASCAAEALRLIGDRRGASELGARARAIVERHYARSTARGALARLVTRGTQA